MDIVIGKMSNKMYEEAWISNKAEVLGPNSPSSRQRATVLLAALGDPSVVSSKV